MRHHTTIFLMLTLLLVSTLSAVGAVKADTALESITFHKVSGESDALSFVLTAENTPKIFMIAGDAPRIVVDFFNTRCSPHINRDMEINGAMVKQVRVGIHNEQPRKTRVVVDLVRGGDYRYALYVDPKTKIRTLTIFHKEKNVTSGRENIKPHREVRKVSPPDKHGSTAQQEQASSPKAAAKTAKMVTTAQPSTAGNQPAEEKAELKKPASGSVQKKTTAAKEQKVEPEQKMAGVQTVTKKIVPLLSDVTFEKTANKGEMVLFKLNDFFPPKVTGSEKGQPRVICDFFDTRLGEAVKKSIRCNGEYVLSVQITRQTKPDKIRVVLNLAPNKNYDLQQVFFKEDKLFVLIVNSQDVLPVKKTTATL